MAPSLETPCIDTKQQWSLKRVPTDSSKRHAQKLDDEDPLGHFRDEFIIPSRGGINKKSLSKSNQYLKNLRKNNQNQIAHAYD